MIPMEVLQMIAQFMGRVELKAAEIDAYQTCMQALQDEFQQQQSTPVEETPNDDAS